MSKPSIRTNYILVLCLIPSTQLKFHVRPIYDTLYHNVFRLNPKSLRRSDLTFNPLFFGSLEGFLHSSIAFFCIYFVLLDIFLVYLRFLDIFFPHLGFCHVFSTFISFRRFLPPCKSFNRLPPSFRTHNLIYHLGLFEFFIIHLGLLEAFHIHLKLPGILSSI